MGPFGSSLNSVSGRLCETDLFTPLALLLNACEACRPLEAPPPPPPPTRAHVSFVRAPGRRFSGAEENARGGALWVHLFRRGGSKIY